MHTQHNVGDKLMLSTSLSVYLGQFQASSHITMLMLNQISEICILVIYQVA